MRLRLHPCLLALIALDLVAAGGAAAIPERADDPPVAVYRHGEVRAAELEAWRLYRRPGLVPPLAERDRRRLIARLVVARVEAGRFADSDLAAAPEYPAWRLLLAARRASGSLVAALKATLRVPESELRAAYDAEADRHHSSARWQLQEIFKRFPEGAEAEATARQRTEMEELRRRALAGEDFAALARAESESTSRARGGRVGWVQLDRLRGPIRDAVAGLAPGELTPVLDTGEGLALLRCQSFLPAVEESFADAREAIEKRLIGDRLPAAVRALDASLRAAAQPTLRPEALASADGPPPIEWRDGDAGRSLARLDVVLFLRDRGWPEPAAVGAADLERLLGERLRLELRAAEAARRGLVDDPAYRDRMRWADLELRAELWERREVASRLAPPTDAELHASFEAHCDTYRTPERLELEAIALGIDRQRPQELYERARRLGDRLVAGEASFAEAVAALVPPAEVRDFGSLTAREAWRLGLNVEHALADLEPGGSSGLVQEGTTLYLLHLVSRQPARPQTFDEARSAVAGELTRRRSQALRGEIRRQILADEALRLIPAPGALAP
jgi:parvulin-like peptidyl-prolyl isomerase